MITWKLVQWFADGLLIHIFYFRDWISNLEIMQINGENIYKRSFIMMQIEPLYVDLYKTIQNDTFRRKFDEVKLTSVNLFM